MSSLNHVNSTLLMGLLAFQSPRSTAIPGPKSGASRFWGFPADVVEQHLPGIVAKVTLLRTQVEPALLGTSGNSWTWGKLGWSSMCRFPSVERARQSPSLSSVHQLFLCNNQLHKRSHTIPNVRCIMLLTLCQFNHI